MNSRATFKRSWADELRRNINKKKTMASWMGSGTHACGLITAPSMIVSARRHYHREPSRFRISALIIEDGTEGLTRSNPDNPNDTPHGLGWFGVV
jgi:hypothetical protein